MVCLAVLLRAYRSGVNSEVVGSGSCDNLVVVAIAFDLDLGRRLQNVLVPDNQSFLATAPPLDALAAESIPSPPQQKLALVALVPAWRDWASLVPAWRDSAAKYDHRLGAEKDQMWTVVPQQDEDPDAPTKVLACADVYAAAVMHPLRCHD
jgi:hypothetical protein